MQKKSVNDTTETSASLTDFKAGDFVQIVSAPNRPKLVGHFFIIHGKVDNTSPTNSATLVSALGIKAEALGARLMNTAQPDRTTAALWQLRKVEDYDEAD